MLVLSDLFWTMHPVTQTVNQHFSLDVLRCLWDMVCRKRLPKWEAALWTHVVDSHTAISYRSFWLTTRSLWSRTHLIHLTWSHVIFFSSKSCDVSAKGLSPEILRRASNNGRSAEVNVFEQEGHNLNVFLLNFMFSRKKSVSLNLESTLYVQILGVQPTAWCLKLYWGCCCQPNESQAPLLVSLLVLIQSLFMCRSNYPYGQLWHSLRTMLTTIHASHTWVLVRPG